MSRVFCEVHFYQLLQEHNLLDVLRSTQHHPRTYFSSLRTQHNVMLKTAANALRERMKGAVVVMVDTFEFVFSAMADADAAGEPPLSCPCNWNWLGHPGWKALSYKSLAEQVLLAIQPDQSKYAFRRWQTTGHGQCA
jgi:hypothetical protein